MTKGDLIQSLEKYSDDEEIGAFWDDSAWPIHGVFEAVDNPETTNGNFYILIDCR